MEKVIVKRAIPGLFDTGEILVKHGDYFIKSGDYSDISKGCIFNLSYSNSISANIVYDHVPNFFEFIVDDVYTSEVIEDITESYPLEVIRGAEEIKARYEYYKANLAVSRFNKEAAAVYQNLMWFIDWLVGDKELITRA